MVNSLLLATGRHPVSQGVVDCAGRRRACFWYLPREFPEGMHSNVVRDLLGVI